LVEDYHQRWLADPDSVDESWRSFFEGYELGKTPMRADAGVQGVGPPPAQEAVKGVTRLVDAYRELGHTLADLDPLKLTPRRQSDEHLDLATFGLSQEDMDQVFFSRLSECNYCTLRELLAILRKTYCRTIGVEFMHIRNLEVRRWLLERMEPIRNSPRPDLK
jgi:2-oxoglutarate dehydrogenase E1 component